MGHEARRQGFLVLFFKKEHCLFSVGIEAGFLPRHHLDPFDRTLIARARVEGLTLVTVDPAIRLS
jgi:PIN domain nuclease of toxin-antitoxin system